MENIKRAGYGSGPLGSYGFGGHGVESYGVQNCGLTKYSGQSINLQASPDGAIGPYHVRFFRMPASGAVNALSYGEIGGARTVC